MGCSGCGGGNKMRSFYQTSNLVCAVRVDKTARLVNVKGPVTGAGYGWRRRDEQFCVKAVDAVDSLQIVHNCTVKCS